MADLYRLRVLFRHASHFGKGGEIGRHVMPLNLSEVGNAIDDCISRGFDTLVLYSSLPAPDLFRPYFDQFWDTEIERGDLVLYL